MTAAEDQGKKNAEDFRNRIRTKVDRRRAAGIPDHVPGPLPDHARVVVNGVPREMMTRLQQLASQSNLSMSQLGLLALETLLTAGPEGKPVFLPHWSKPVDR